ncbi:TetR/AcrR family transcriptional regulator [Streptomyces sp. NPDC091290]|uniref:TetR/AcrR family transcriptional regulator n=1 Tax=Streptomyces sp. NPDC091290 TaxID=3365990 RepID=UPI0037F88820
MSRPRGFDPERVVDAAMDAFWSKGYAATSAQDLVDCTGLGRGSIYNTFSSKRHLFLEALRRYEGVWTARQVAVLEGDGPVQDRIRLVLMTVVDEETAETPARRGCLAVNAAIELAGRDPEVAQLVRHIFVRMEDALCEALQRAKRDGEIGLDRDARSLARHLLSSMYGLRVLGKTADRYAMTSIVDSAIGCL